MTSFEDLVEASKDIKWSPLALEKDKVTKAVMINFAQYLLTELRAQESAQTRVNAQFQTTIVNLVDEFTKSTEKLTNEKFESVVDPVRQNLEEVKAIVNNIKKPTANKESDYNTMADAQNTNEIELPEPYSDLKEDFLDAELMKELEDLANSVDYTAIGNQRRVKYYGEYRYQYTGGSHDPCVPPEPIKKLLQKISDVNPDSEKGISCMISEYENGTNFCPPHMDDEKSISPTSDIYTFSLGATRIMELTAVLNDKCVTRTIPLPNNSLLTFSRQSQAYWKHGIPAAECTDKRWSFTVRVNKPHFLNSSIIYGDSNTKKLQFGDGIGKFGVWVPGQRVKTQRIHDIPPVEKIPPYQNIIIHTGVNDVLAKNNKKSCRELLHELENKCRDIHRVYPKSTIILSPLLPTKLASINQQIWDINNGIINISKQHHNTIYMDNSKFAGQDDCLRPEYGLYYNPDDCIHLGKKGTIEFAMSIKSYILRKNPMIKNSMDYHSAYNNDRYS